MAEEPPQVGVGQGASFQEFRTMSCEYSRRTASGNVDRRPGEGGDPQPMLITFTADHAERCGMIHGTLINEGVVTQGQAGQAFPPLAVVNSRGRIEDTGVFGYFRIQTRSGIKLDFVLEDQSDTERLNEMIRQWRMWKILEDSTARYEKEDVETGQASTESIGPGTSTREREGQEGWPFIGRRLIN